MGMRDESWCNGCGTSVPYSDADEHYCAECSADNITESILAFVKGRIAELTEYRDNEIAIGEYELQDYTAGCIDAYDIIRIKLEGVNG